jgi:nucleoid-associated protein YgaU
MTADAKIGLLLGLVFIFIIAFLINGLPDFRDDTNKLTTSMADFSDDSPGLAGRERRAQEALGRVGPIDAQRGGTLNETQPSLADGQGVRTVISLPPNGAAREPNQPLRIEPSVDLLQSARVAAEDTEVKKPAPVKPVWPKVYVVQQDDNLATIAKKFYGPEQGNKRINITRIFNANRKLLTSPHEIDLGQKLIIPELPASMPAKDKAESVLRATMFEQVESIGRKLVSVDRDKAEQGRWYVVREGDNLWKIAAEKLGSGPRYSEISRLNADILDSEDDIPVGMRLRMPAR